MNLIYLDNNATTRPAPQVCDAMREMLEQHWGNPSSVHRFGQAARHRIELARQSVAELVGARPREIVFTSGGTESNNLTLWGLLGPAMGLFGAGNRRRAVLVTTPVEHSAVREPAEAIEAAGTQVERLDVDAAGRVQPRQLADLLGELAASDEPTVAVVSVQWANNETGVIQPIEALAEAIAHARQPAEGASGKARPSRSCRIYLHVDATQAVGKLPVDAASAGLDLMTFSAHKLHGPKGVGALWVRSGVRLAAQQRGGPQERELRGGTENTAGIVGMGVAADLARQFLADASRITELEQLRDRFEQQVVAKVPDAVIHARELDGERVPRLWNTSNIGFPGVEAEAVLLALSERGVCASAGAACSSGSLDPSPVLLAMNVPEPVAHGSVRFSLSRYTTADEIEGAVTEVARVIERLSRTMPMSR